MSGGGAAFDADVRLLHATEDVGGELDGFGFFFRVTGRSAVIVGAWVGARPRPKSPVEFEVALDVDSQTVGVGVNATIFNPVAVLNI